MIRRFTAFAFGLLLALVGAASAAFAQAPWPRGEIIPKIATAKGDANYALYLPPTYDPSRAWPIVFVLDPRGQAVAAAERFRPGAERYGYILVSAYESRSDEGTEANLPALKALMREAGDRLSFDTKRIYLAGFSGTARFAIALARQSRPGLIAGILAAGAGYPVGMKPRAGDDFALYATVGEEDFNWPELHHLEPDLARSGIISFLDTHVGPHDWPPPNIGTDGLGWFALHATRKGGTAADPKLVEGLWASFATRAEADEAAGDLIAAQRIWAMLANRFAGLRDTREAAAKAGTLAADPRFAAAVRTRDQLIGEFDSMYSQAWAAFDMKDVASAADFLELDRLNRQAAADPDPRRRASAKRMLAYIAGQAGSYRVGKPIKERDWKRALLLMSIAVRAQPGASWRYVNRAQIEMKAGNRRRALADLAKAAELGFAGARVVEEDEDFKPLHGEPGFPSIIARMKANKSQ